MLDAQEKPTVLLVDDAKENINILLSLLGDYDLIVALNGEKALKQVAKHRVDLILLDIIMPGMDGYAVCQQLKADPKTAKIPVIFITAKSDEASIEKGFDLGGADYVTKPFRPKELLARVKTQLQLHALLRALEYAAHRDPMTGVYNRRRFFELAGPLLDQGTSFALMLDIDKFKSVNDTYGHATGDEVIKFVTRVAQTKLDAQDILGRLGGEEFAVIGPAEGLPQVLEKAEAIRQAVEQEFEDPRFRVTISIGTALRADQESIDQLLARADEALYQAKTQGRNRVCAR